MRKAIFTLLIAICAIAVVNAQDLTSKKGVPILPEEGDYSLGINAIPFLNYVGNIFNGNTFNNAPFFTYKANVAPGAIYGKKFITAQKAYRGYIRIGYTSFSDKEVVPDATTPDAFVEDKQTTNNMNVGIGFGMEHRRGKGRVQGIYGWEAGIGFSNMTEKYEYGNTAGEGVPFYHFEEGFVDVMSAENPRVTEIKFGSEFGIGVRAFVGVEYFFAPKMSLGGEFGWGLGIATMGKATVTVEDVTAAETESEGASDFQFYLDTDNWGGAITLNFYF